MRETHPDSLSPNPNVATAISRRQYDRPVAPNVLFTIGHSTHSIEEFIALLNTHNVRHLVDVRSIPKSRHVPQFNTDELASSLRAANIEYTHLKALGGRRSHPQRLHQHRLAQHILPRLCRLHGHAAIRRRPSRPHANRAAQHPTAIMCAEAVPWRCHRSLIADAMMLQGWQVHDILTRAPAAEHKLTPFLKIINGQPTYPNPDGPATLFDQPR